MIPRWFASEVLGTFVMVLFGLGVVATAIALNAPVGMFQIAAVWGLGLSCAIFIAAEHSGAHLNPAITIAFAVFRDFPARRIPGYILAQLTGAFLGACAVFLLFNSSITAFEETNHITRGMPGSEASAMIFGEYFPDPGGQPLKESDLERISHLNAFFAEFMGTLMLALVVFGFTARNNKSGPGPMTPIAIGIGLTTIISVFAPITQAGLNPARDLAPRIFSSIAGWGEVPFTVNGHGWFTVYIIAPCLGALCGAFLANQLFSSRTD
ncbi:MAG: MIP family channel protein [Verrucomicrobiales bacterium]|nr:MIP family channel protein [Verrucomicrobiales bacterium]